jgi:predicted enzyme related to lactoylglutathione lyase
VATILDPSDAVVRLWDQPAGAERPRPDAAGAPAWFELETNDVDGARKFYGELFGWDAGEVDDPTGSDPYVVFTCEGVPVAGAVWSPLADVPASWCTAFAVDDTDEATRRATEAGGVVLTDPTEMVRGRQSVVVDPTGAVFALLGPAATGPRLL